MTTAVIWTSVPPPKTFLTILSAQYDSCWLLLNLLLVGHVSSRCLGLFTHRLKTPVGPAGDGAPLTPTCLKNTQVYVVQLGLRGLIWHHVSHLRGAGRAGVRGRERSGLREEVCEARQHLRVCPRSAGGCAASSCVSAHSQLSRAFLVVVRSTPFPPRIHGGAAVPADIIWIQAMCTHQLHFLLTPDGSETRRGGD